MERKVMIFEYSIYTDMDCTNPFRKGFISRNSSYVEPTLCEYEKRDCEDDIVEIRRVFDFTDDGKKELMDLINFLDENNTSRDDFTAMHLHKFYEELKETVQKYIFTELSSYASDFIDSNYEVEYDITVKAINVDKIK